AASHRHAAGGRDRTAAASRGGDRVVDQVERGRDGVVRDHVGERETRDRPLGDAIHQHTRGGVAGVRRDRERLVRSTAYRHAAGGRNRTATASRCGDRVVDQVERGRDGV